MVQKVQILSVLRTMNGVHVINYLSSSWEEIITLRKEIIRVSYNNCHRLFAENSLG